MKFTISCLLTLQMSHTKFGEDWPSSFRDEDVNERRTTDDALRWTPTDSNKVFFRLKKYKNGFEILFEPCFKYPLRNRKALEIKIY